MEKDLYILTIWNGVEPILTGPFVDEEARQTALSGQKKEYGEESCYYPVDTSKDANVHIGNF